MKHYELLYLVSGSIPETELERIQKEVSGWIENEGGKITTHDAWGKRRLTYPIRKEQHGYYFLTEFDGEGASIAALNKRLHLATDIMRYMLVTKKPLSATELLKMEIAQKRAQARRAAAQTKKEPGRSVTAEEREKEKDSSKIKLEELDKKLDELLDQDIVS